MAWTISYEGYHLDLEDLYARMWMIASDGAGDGTRLFRPRPGDRQALKWLIEDLSGAMADPVRTTRANNALRRQVHHALVEAGWAERINQMSFRLLVSPEDLAAAHDGEERLLDESGESGDVTDGGVAIANVPAVTVSTDLGTLELAGLEWSPWSSIEHAAKQATTSPGVYAVRSDGDIVYIGMAGVRRGQGVRGRLRVYARGRGAVSGLGEAALDRALSDPAWLTQRLTALLSEGPSRAKDWAVAALHRAQVEICWAAAPDASTAREWELQALQELEDAALWNRARPAGSPTDPEG